MPVNIIRPQNNLVLPGRGVQVMSPGAVGGAAGWWLSGGISAANCIAAYQPKGAASYAASKINLANPGTYDLQEYNSPSWDSTNGWGVGGSSGYFDTGITPASTWSVAVRYSNETNNSAWLFGLYEDANTAYGIRPYEGVSYFSGPKTTVAPELSSGVLIMANRNGYRNGILDTASISAMVGEPTISVYLLRRNYSNTAPMTGYIQAFAIYNTTITAPQASALSTAMAAL